MNPAVPASAPNGVTPDKAAPAESGITSWIRRHSLLTFALLVAIASLRIVSTYTVFSHTYDEPAHIASGMEWLARGAYHYEPLHPPLARIATALGPFLDGGASHDKPDMWDEGAAILSAKGHYDRTLALARFGILPFFWVACLVVYLWSRKYLGEPSAALAVLIFTLLPPILAHAGLATTDMAVAAMVGASFLTGINWCERPGLANSLLFGASTALAVLSKFSALVFIPASFSAAFAFYLLAERPRARELISQGRRLLPRFCMVLLLEFCVIWAGYRFSAGHVWFTSMRLPFPELYAGIHQLIEHQQLGAGSTYLLGQHSDTGWWWYYFVVLGVKTPLAFLSLLACGLFVIAHKDAPRGLCLALVFSCGILLTCLFSRINLGVRHILPIYLGFSIVAAAGAKAVMDQASSWRPAGWIGSALLISLTASSLLSHPDYIAYFNALAGPHPEHVLVDSDLDWGQDMKRLAERLQDSGAKQLAFTSCLRATNSTSPGLPPTTPTDFLNPSPGWNAVRLTVFELALADKRSKNPRLRFWPEAIAPSETIGKGILLWYFPPETLPPPSLPGIGVGC